MSNCRLDSAFALFAIKSKRFSLVKWTGHLKRSHRLPTAAFSAALLTLSLFSAVGVASFSITQCRADDLDSDHLPNISVQTFPAQIDKRSASGRVYLLSSPGTTPENLPKPGRLFLALRDQKPVMAFRVLRVYADKNQVAAKWLRRYYGTKNLDAGQKYDAIEKMSDLINAPLSSQDKKDLKELETPPPPPPDSAMNAVPNAAMGAAPSTSVPPASAAQMIPPPTPLAPVQNNSMVPPPPTAPLQAPPQMIPPPTTPAAPVAAPMTAPNGGDVPPPPPLDNAASTAPGNAAIDANPPPPPSDLSTPPPPAAAAAPVAKPQSTPPPMDEPPPPSRGGGDANVENPPPPSAVNAQPVPAARAYDSELDAGSSPQPGTIDNPDNRPSDETQLDDMSNIMVTELRPIDHHLNFLAGGVGFFRNNGIQTGAAITTTNPNGTQAGAPFYSPGGFLRYSRIINQNIYFPKSNTQDDLSIDATLGYYRILGYVTNSGDSYTLVPFAATLRYTVMPTADFGVFGYAGLMQNIVIQDLNADVNALKQLRSTIPAIGVGLLFRVGPAWYMRADVGFDMLDVSLALRF